MSGTNLDESSSEDASILEGLYKGRGVGISCNEWGAMLLYDQVLW